MGARAVALPQLGSWVSSPGGRETAFDDEKHFAFDGSGLDDVCGLGRSQAGHVLAEQCDVADLRTIDFALSGFASRVFGPSVTGSPEQYRAQREPWRSLICLTLVVLLQLANCDCSAFRETPGTYSLRSRRTLESMAISPTLQ